MTPMSTPATNSAIPAAQPVIVSPLVLADRLLGLAQDADQAGLRRPAADLVRLAFAMYDEVPQQRCFTCAWDAYPSA